MKKIYITNIIIFTVGISCFIAYKLIGSEITSNGTLIEPFALIPIGWLFIISGIILGIFLTIRNKK